MSENDPSTTSVTEILGRVSSENDDVSAQLLPLVYDQLRAIAARRMASENPGHTLEATALVHEAFLKLVGPRQIPWQSSAHFYSAAGEAMRRVLLDHARGKHRQKRGGEAKKVILNVADLAANENPEEILALDEAFHRLEQQEPEAADVVRLRFFAGLSVDQTAEALQLSPRTVDRRWKFARAWMFRELS